MEWEMVCGLEVHVQLNTKTKLFSPMSTDFGQAPNTQTNEICQGHPGVLPRLNEAALEKAIMAGLATDCRINHFSKFDRKNYFYPDLPKAYQITQFEKPICEEGFIDLKVQTHSKELIEKRVRITRIHLEEDAGKLMHSQVGAVAESYVDLNRAGTPLIEIVSEPDIRSSDEAVAYLQTLKSVMQYINVSNVNMEEGSLRCDANVSVRPKGSTELGNRTEIKNMNSFRNLQAAMEYEMRRQIRVLEEGGKIETETLLWDANERKTRSMRSKEEAHDYRYFPEPDLPPVLLKQEQIDAIEKNLPELPRQKQERYVSELGLSEYDAGVLTSEKELADYYETALSHFSKEPKKLCNWVAVELLAKLKEEQIEISDCKVKPEAIAQLVELIADDTINGKIGKQIFPEMFESGKMPSVIVDEKGLKVVSDDGLIREVLQKLFTENPDVVERYKGGNTKVTGFFVGQVMKATQGQASPQIINKLIAEMLSN